MARGRLMTVVAVAVLLACCWHCSLGRSSASCYSSPKCTSNSSWDYVMFVSR